MLIVNNIVKAKGLQNTLKWELILYLPVSVKQMSISVKVHA